MLAFQPESAKLIAVGNHVNRPNLKQARQNLSIDTKRFEIGGAGGQSVFCVEDTNTASCGVGAGVAAGSNPVAAIESETIVLFVG